MSYSIFDYPAERIIYNKTIGKLRVDNISTVLENEFGFNIKKYPIESNGIDLSIHDNNGNMLAVLEITNWRFTSYFNTYRQYRTLTNLTKYPCTRILVVSFMENVTENTGNFLDELKANDVKIIDFGFQTQPSSYLDWFRKNDPILCDDCKLPDDPCVRGTIMDKFTFLIK
ncbi:MAG: hypothetical protein NUK62_08720 [Tenericutes bacterium]|nr:hypothetical protein [Mycoplasmatota bacterium]